MERGRRQEKVRDPRCSPERHQEHGGPWNRLEECGVQDGEGKSVGQKNELGPGPGPWKPRAM